MLVPRRALGSDGYSPSCFGEGCGGAQPDRWPPIHLGSFSERGCQRDDRRAHDQFLASRGDIPCPRNGAAGLRSPNKFAEQFLFFSWLLRQACISPANPTLVCLIRLDANGAYAVPDEHRVSIPQETCNRPVQENKLAQAVPAVFVWVSLSWIRNERFSDVITTLSSRASQPTAQSKTGVLPFTSFLSFAPGQLTSVVERVPDNSRS